MSPNRVFRATERNVSVTSSTDEALGHLSLSISSSSGKTSTLGPLLAGGLGYRSISIRLAQGKCNPCLGEMLLLDPGLFSECTIVLKILKSGTGQVPGAVHLRHNCPSTLNDNS